MSDIYPLTPMQQLLFTMDAAEASSGFEREFLLEGRSKPDACGPPGGT